MARGKFDGLRLDLTGPPEQAAVGRGLVGHGGGPAEAGEFAGDGDGRDVAGFTACAQPLGEAVEPSLRAQRDLDDVVGLTGAPVGERGADARAHDVLPGRLDEQAAGVAAAGLGNRPLAAALAGLVE